MVGFGWNWRVRVCWPDVLLGGAVGELVSEVTAVGKYAGRPLKAGDAAQLVGCSARFVPAVFGPFGSAVHGMPDLVYGKGKIRHAVHGMGYLVYGKGKSVMPYTEGVVWCMGQFKKL